MTVTGVAPVIYWSTDTSQSPAAPSCNADTVSATVSRGSYTNVFIWAFNLANIQSGPCTFSYSGANVNQFPTPQSIYGNTMYPDSRLVVYYHFNPVSLNAGTYTEKITLSCPGSAPVSTNVNLIVSP